MPRAGLNRTAVVEAALAVVDAGGPTGFADLTLAAVAARVGVAVPSLYKHVHGLPDLRRGVVQVCVVDLADALTAATAGLAGARAVHAAAGAVRTFARTTPGRYAATQRAEWAVDPAAAEIRAAAARTVAVIAGALQPLDVPPERTIDAVRAVRAAVHGFVVLELEGGFGLPDDVDVSFDYLITTVIQGLVSASGSPAGRGG